MILYYVALISKFISMPLPLIATGRKGVEHRSAPRRAGALSRRDKTAAALWTRAMGRTVPQLSSKSGALVCTANGGTDRCRDVCARLQPR